MKPNTPIIVLLTGFKLTTGLRDILFRVFED